MIVFAIVVLAGIVGLYAVAIKRVWQGASEYDPSDPPAWWPFSLPLWHGVSRAFPVQGACLILLIGGGIAGDIVGKDSSGYNVAMSIGLLGLLAGLLLGLPITFFNRPRFLVPPDQRDDPGAFAEWRRERARR
jgi:hypothetical protein